jgi:hypothetical protein
MSFWNVGMYCWGVDLLCGIVVVVCSEFYVLLPLSVGVVVVANTHTQEHKNRAM